MLHARDADAGRVRLVWGAFTLLTFGALFSTSVLFARPVLAATWTSPLTVGLAPESARPGEEVVVSFSSKDPQVSITSCQAQLDGEVHSDCRESAGQWSVHFTVPTDASPGATQVDWGLGFRSQSRSLVLDTTSDAHGYTKGTLPFTVLPAKAGFTVEVSPRSARPQQHVTVSFTPTDASNSITSCQVRLDDATYNECNATDGRRSVRFTVPLGTAPGARTLEWELGYQYPDPDGLGEGEANGTVDFTVRPPQPSRPTFSVGLRPGSAHPGDAMTVSLAARDRGVSITGCSAQFGDDSFNDCRPVEDHWSLHVAVPSDALPGATTVGWNLTYRDIRPGARTQGRANGFLEITVLPAPSATPTFSVELSPESADPGTVVTLSFSPRDPSTTITGCTARFAAETFRDCRRSGDQWALRLTVPDDAEPGGGSVHWTLSYAFRTTADSGETDGDLILTVLSPPVPPDGDVGASFGIGLGTVPLALLVIVGFTLAVLRGSRSRARGDRPNHVLSNQAVRATAHAGPLPRLTVTDREPTRSRVVRFAARRPPAVVEVKEVSR